MKNETWLFIEHYIYLEVKKYKVLLYNPLNPHILEYVSKDISLIVKRLKDKNDLFLIKLTNQELEKQSIKEFIHDIKRYFFGDLINTQWINEGSSTLISRFKIQNNTHKLQYINISDLSNILWEQNSELTIYLNNRCTLNCKICGEAHKQFLFCLTENICRDLPFELVKELISEMEMNSIKTLNITGGNIFLYKNIYDLLHFVKNKKGLYFKYYIHYMNIYNMIKDLNKFSAENNMIVILINFPIYAEKIDMVIKSMKSFNLAFEIHFVISSIIENKFIYEKCNNAWENTEYRMLPFFNGKNYSFFKQFVLISKIDFNTKQVDFTSAFLNRRINLNFFGKLFILSDGSIRSNINKNPLGVYGLKKLEDYITSEKNKSEIWFKIKRYVKPCRSCLYNNICPPISNYELVMQKNNLCDIWKG